MATISNSLSQIHSSVYVLQAENSMTGQVEHRWRSADTSLAEIQ